MQFVGLVTTCELERPLTIFVTRRPLTNASALGQGESSSFATTDEPLEKEGEMHLAGKSGIDVDA